MKSPAPQLRLAGLTLVELLVVLAILGLLALVMLPAVQAARESSRRATCQNNLRQIALAVHLYGDQHDETLPALWRTSAVRPWDNFSWRVTLLPQLELGPLHDALHLQEPPLAAPNVEVCRTRVPLFECPSTFSMPRRIPAMGFEESRYENVDAAACDYSAVHDVAVVGRELPIRGIFNGGPELVLTTEDTTLPGVNQDTFNPELRTRPGSFRKVVDGLSHTALLVEQAGKPDLYDEHRLPSPVDPAEGAWATAEFSSFQGRGINYDNHADPYAFHTTLTLAMGDGSVSVLDSSVDQAIVSALLSRDGREIISPSDWK